MEGYRGYVPLILRVSLGLTLIFWGYEKLTLEKLAKSYVMDYGSFMVMDVQSFLVAAGLVQLVLGISMISGFYTRVSAGLLALMAVVTILVPGAFIMRDVPHFAYAFATAGGAASLFIMGGGAYSLDGLMGERLREAHGHR